MFEPDFDWVKKWAKYTPERMMLRDYEREMEWTYFDFNRRCEALAVLLRDKFHVGKKDRLAVLSKKRAKNLPRMIGNSV